MLRFIGFCTVVWFLFWSGLAQWFAAFIAALLLHLAAL